MKNALWF